MSNLWLGLWAVVLDESGYRAQGLLGNVFQKQNKELAEGTLYEVAIPYLQERFVAGDEGQLVECLPSMHDILVQSQALNKTQWLCTPGIIALRKRK